MKYRKPGQRPNERNLKGSKWKKTPTPRPQLNPQTYGRMGILMENARNRIDELFGDLGVDLDFHRKRYVGSCPVHGGDNYQALNFYPDGREGKAFWQCLTNHCEKHFKGNLIGFVRGVLSQQEHAWSAPGDKEVTLQAATSYLCNFLGTTWESLSPDFQQASNNSFAAAVSEFTINPREFEQNGICSRERLRSLLEIPAEYYLKRGFKPETLDRYDIGLCLHPSAELCDRVVIPIYDQEHRTVLGCLGRSPYDKCPNCRHYHNPQGRCFTEGSAFYNYCKVRTSKGFSDKNFLYNYWFAKPHIIPMGRCIVIVEGCADVWRLYEAGIPNAVALNGSELTQTQQSILESSGATTAYCLTDNDEAGERVYEDLLNTGWFSRKSIIRPAFGGKDVGGMDTYDIQQHQFYHELKARITYDIEEANNTGLFRP